MFSSRKTPLRRLALWTLALYAVFTLVPAVVYGCYQWGKAEPESSSLEESPPGFLEGTPLEEASPLPEEGGERFAVYDTATGETYSLTPEEFLPWALACEMDLSAPDEALKAQIDKLMHTSNLYYNEPAARAAEKLVSLSGMSKVFFTNSGTEAIEGALKAARKYTYAKGRTDAYEIIAMNHSFHGRSMGALSVTGNEHYQIPFRPLVGGIRFADYNDLESVKAQFSEHTCAVILETVQGEGGIYPAKLVNTVGAGDSFIAGFLYEILMGSDIEKCLDTGARVAAKVVSTFNPWED